MARKKKQLEPTNRTGQPIVKIFGSAPSDEVIEAVKVYLKAVGFSKAYILVIPLFPLVAIDLAGQKPDSAFQNTLVILPVDRNEFSFYPYTKIDRKIFDDALRRLHIALDKIPNCNVLIETNELKQEDIGSSIEFRH